MDGIKDPMNDEEWATLRTRLLRGDPTTAMARMCEAAVIEIERLRAHHKRMVCEIESLTRLADLTAPIGKPLTGDEPHAESR